jgi:CheY-like chemotaxis protein
MAFDHRFDAASTTATPLILIADDSPGDVLLLREAFHTQGCTHPLAWVGDGHSALRRLAQDPCGVRLVVLDLSLPGMPGREVLAGLRQMNAPPPVVVLTGSSRSADRRVCLQLGAVSYHVKPMYFGEWLRLVSQILQVAPSPSAAVAVSAPALSNEPRPSRPPPRSRVTA